MPTYERDAIRPNVFGHFRTLLEDREKPRNAVLPGQLAIGGAGKGRQRTPSAAARSRSERELRPRADGLHTLGVDGGYTQKDIIEVARCFTGWTISSPAWVVASNITTNSTTRAKGGAWLRSRPVEAWSDGERLDILAARFHSPLYLAQTGCRFVADNPPPALVERMANAYLKTKGNLREVFGQ